MTAQVCPNGAKRTKHHKQRPMQRTNSIQLLDTINATAFRQCHNHKSSHFQCDFQQPARWPLLRGRLFRHLSLSPSANPRDTSGMIFEMYRRISSISFSRFSAIRLRTMACAVNKEDRATWIWTSVAGHSRFLSHSVASSASSRLAVVSRSLAAASRRSQRRYLDTNVLVDGLGHGICLPVDLETRAGLLRGWRPSRMVSRMDFSQTVP